MRTAHIYARYSLKYQADGDSLKRQVERAEEYAREQQWQIAEVITDLGVSAYHGRNLKDGALGEFIAAVEAGLVAPAAILIVESLDRLSRDTLTEQFALLLRLIRNGIELVTLFDKKHFTSATINSNPLGLIVSLAIMLRARSESDLKSVRVSAAWARKRLNATQKFLTRKCPPWLVINETRTEVHLVAGRAQSATAIIEWAAAGWTPQMILEKLTLDGNSAWGKDQAWTMTKVLDVLYNRAVLGEFQPHKYVDGRRVSEGEPVSGYFPAIVTSDTYAKAIRNLCFDKGARHGDKNLFIGLVWDGKTGERVVKRNEYLTDESSNRGGLKQRWAYRAFEQNLLSLLEQLDWEAVLRPQDANLSGNVRDRLVARLGEAEHRLERSVQRVVAEASPGGELAKALTREEEECRDLRDKLAQLDSGRLDQVAVRAEMRQARSELMQLVATGHAESRVLIRQQLRILIERIVLWPHSGSSDKFTALLPLLKNVQTQSGLEWLDDPQDWPCYQLIFANGQERWVICERSHFSKTDLQSPLCKDNAAIVMLMPTSG